MVEFGTDLTEIGASLFGERNDIRELVVPNNVTDITDTPHSAPFIFLTIIYFCFQKVNTIS